MAIFVWTGTTSTLYSTGLNWNVGGVAQAAPPTAADDVAVGTGTGATNNALTIDSGAVCRSADFTGYTGTATHNAITWTIGDGTAGAGNIALKLVAGMTYTRVNSATSAISFISTSGTQQTITTASKTMGNMTISGAGSSYLLGDALTGGSGATFTLTAGTFDTGNNAWTFGIYSSAGSGTRVLTGGTTNFSTSATGAVTNWNQSTTTNFTQTMTNSTITLSGSGTQGIVGGGLTFGTITSSTSGEKRMNTLTCTQLTRVGTAVATDSLTFAANVTATNVTVTGNSSTNTVIVKSSTAATQRTLTCSGTFSLTNVGNIQDMVFSGQKFDAPSTATNGGDNAGIAFPGTPSFIQSAGVSVTTPASSATITFGTATRNTTTTTSQIVVVIQNRNSATGTTVTSTTDSASNTHSLIATTNTTFSTAQGDHEWWWCSSATGGVTTVTVNTGTTANFAAFAYELTDANTVDQIIQNTSAGASNSPMTAGPTGTTTAANEVIIAASGVHVGTSAIGASTGYTMQTQQGSNSAPILQARGGIQTATATGTFSTSMTASVTGLWVATIVTFKYIPPATIPEGNLLLLGVG